MIVLAAVLTGLYAIAGATLYAYQRTLIFHQDRTDQPPGSIGLPDAIVHHLVASDGVELVAWLLPGAPGRLTIYFHGNGGSLPWRGDRIRQLAEFGGSVLALEYRGYGGSGGTPSEDGLLHDAEAAWQFAIGLGYRPEQIVLYGESLGSGVAVQLAARRTVGALVLDAPFSSLVDVAADRYPMFPVRMLLKDQFRSDLKIAGLKAPVLILHGTEDDVVPIRYGRRLAELGRPNTTLHVVEGADHVVLSDAGARRTAIRWLAENMPASAGSATRQAR